MDVRKVKALGSLLLKLETHSRTGSNRKLILIYITFLIPGVFIPWLLARQNTDPSGFQFAFLSFLLYSITICFTIINELDNIIVSRSEIEIFTSLPLDDNLIVTSKMYMMLRYFFFLSIPLLLPGSIFYYLIMHSALRAFLYFVSGFMLILFLANIIALCYTAAIKLLKADKISSVSLFFQVVLILILIICYQLVSFGISGRAGASVFMYISSAETKGVINYFPQAWYALLPSKNNYALDIALILKVLLPIFICQMSYLSLKWYLQSSYPVIKDKYLYTKAFTENTEPPRFFIFQAISNFIQHVYLRNSLERSSYGLILSLYKKDKLVRLSIVPMVIIPAGLAIFALITNQLSIPFGNNIIGTIPVFHISILLSILVVLNTALYSTKITNSPGAAWIYDAYPVDSLKQFRNGIRKFFVIRFIFPVIFLLFAVMIIKIPVHFTVLHLAFLFAAAGLYNSLYNTFTKVPPFTKQNSFVNSIQRLTSIFFPLVYGVIISVIMLFAYRSIELAVIVTTVILTITFWFNHFAFNIKPKKA